MTFHEHLCFAHGVELVVPLLPLEAQLSLGVHAWHILRADEVLFCNREHAVCADRGVRVGSDLDTTGSRR